MEILKEELVKAEIIEQAKLLFQRFGVEKTSMNEIASAYGKAKSTIYHYFESKEEIFEAVLDKEVNDIFKKYESNIKPDFDATKKLKTYFTTFLVESQEKANVNLVIKKDVSERLGKIMIMKLVQIQKTTIKKIIHEGIDNGEFKYIPEEQIDWVVEAIIGGMFGIIIYYLIGNNDHNFASKMEVVTDILFTGMLKK